ncbi:MAG: hypothetical protein CAPSK01_004169 [Candidatus Accumulibacter vicinus]|uniref:Uncharacterized protein n=1 Tax=Candidatus Accumulibacter vicinus TaxID=2954382 RepID=A0A084XVJ6_9PROT|nr:MAG: hypothetical protein CAPSK01_004169 [Candidatus Accumulibacter vicinus]
MTVWRGVRHLRPLEGRRMSPLHEVSVNSSMRSHPGGWITSYLPNGLARSAVLPIASSFSTISGTICAFDKKPANWW